MECYFVINSVSRFHGFSIGSFLGLSRGIPKDLSRISQGPLRDSQSLIIWLLFWHLSTFTVLHRALLLLHRVPHGHREHAREHEAPQEALPAPRQVSLRAPRRGRRPAQVPAQEGEEVAPPEQVRLLGLGRGRARVRLLPLHSPDLIVLQHLPGVTRVTNILELLCRVQTGVVLDDLSASRMLVQELGDVVHPPLDDGPHGVRVAMMLLHLLPADLPAHIGDAGAISVKELLKQTLSITKTLFLGGCVFNYLVPLYAIYCSCYQFILYSNNFFLFCCILSQV